MALAGLLAAFMAGMAANISSLNTVFTYDLWQDWIRPGRDDRYYLQVGRAVTVIGCVLAIGTAFLAGSYQNLMDYIQALFSFFNAPLFAIFILGLFWKRMTGTAGWTGLVSGTIAAVTVDVLVRTDVLQLSSQAGSFVGASAAFVVGIAVSVGVSTVHGPEAGRGAGRPGLVAHAQGGPRARDHRGGRRLVPVAGHARRPGARPHRRPLPHRPVTEGTPPMPEDRADVPAAVSEAAPSASAALFDLRTVIAVLFGVYGIVLTALGVFSSDPAELAKAGGIDMNLWTGIGMLVLAAVFVTWVWLRPPVTSAPPAKGAPAGAAPAEAAPAEAVE